VFDLALDSANVLPSKYRQVSTAVVESLESGWLTDFFTGREAYRRTRFIIARCGDSNALVELARSDVDSLFAKTTGARVLATPAECVWVRDPSVDCGIASHLAMAAAGHPDKRCVIVEGRYEHVSFLLNPAPLEIEVLDIVPPSESKLVDQARRVLDYDEDLPPILLRPHLIDSRVLVSEEQPDKGVVLVPCRGGAVDLDGVDVRYLDERPEREDWSLLGCQRSQQIHRWFYGGPAESVIDFCPRRFLSDETPGKPRLTRCCLREEGIEVEGSTVVVPWGASLAEVADGLARLATKDAVWTRI